MSRLLKTEKKEMVEVKNKAKYQNNMRKKTVEKSLPGINVKERDLQIFI